MGEINTTELVRYMLEYAPASADAGIAVGELFAEIDDEEWQQRAKVLIEQLVFSVAKEISESIAKFTCAECKARLEAEDRRLEAVMTASPGSAS